MVHTLNEYTSEPDDGLALINFATWKVPATCQHKWSIPAPEEPQSPWTPRLLKDVVSHEAEVGLVGNSQ